MSLSNVRKGHRSHVNKTIDKIKALLAEEAPLTSELKAHQQTLADKLDVIRKLDDTILATLTEDDAIDKEIDDSSDFRTKIQGAIFGVDEKLDKLFQKDGKSVPTPPVINAPPLVKSFEEAKYPKIQI